MVQASFDYIKRKGFKKIYGHAQDRLVNFWAHFGGKPLGHNRKITFSDFSYTEMVLEIEPGPDAITLDSDPYVIVRPVGDWHPAGVLQRSSARRLRPQPSSRADCPKSPIPRSSWSSHERFETTSLERRASWRQNSRPVLAFRFPVSL